MTCTIWLLGYKFLHILMVVSCLHTTWKIVELRGVMKWQFWPISFVSLHALLFWLRIEVVDPRFILNNELWNKFLLGHVCIVREVHQKLVCSSGVTVLDTIWQTQNLYSPKVTLRISCSKPCYTIRSKYYLILFQTELGQAEKVLITPRRPYSWLYTGCLACHFLNIDCFYGCLVFTCW